MYVSSAFAIVGSGLAGHCLAGQAVSAPRTRPIRCCATPVHEGAIWIFTESSASSL